MQRFIPLLLLSLCAATTGAEQYTPDVAEFDGTTSLTFDPSPQLVLADGGTIEFWVVPDWTSDPGYDPVIICNAGPEGASYLVAMLLPLADDGASEVVARFHLPGRYAAVRARIRSLLAGEEATDDALASIGRLGRALLEAAEQVGPEAEVAGHVLNRWAGPAATCFTNWLRMAAELVLGLLLVCSLGLVLWPEPGRASEDTRLALRELTPGSESLQHLDPVHLPPAVPVLNIAQRVSL